MPAAAARGRRATHRYGSCHGSTRRSMSVTRSIQTAPTLLEVSADNWRLAVLVGLVVSAIAAAALPASVSFWIVGAMAALVAAAFVVNAYRRRYYGGRL